MVETHHFTLVDSRGIKTDQENSNCYSKLFIYLHQCNNFPCQIVTVRLLWPQLESSMPQLPKTHILRVVKLKSKNYICYSCNIPPNILEIPHLLIRTQQSSSYATVTTSVTAMSLKFEYVQRTYMHEVTEQLEILVTFKNIYLLHLLRRFPSECIHCASCLTEHEKILSLEFYRNP